VYLRGNVVLIPFPYTDLSAQKTRPAVVVSSDYFHSRRSELLLMYISSQVAKANTDLDYTLQDWREAQLQKPSFARPKIAAVEPTLIVYRIGALTTRDLNGIDLTLLKALGLTNGLLAGADLAILPPASIQRLAEKALETAVSLASPSDNEIDLAALRQLLYQSG
jgi:mRNA interferase MazF